MIVVRDIFQLKFGKARDAQASWKEGFALFTRHFPKYKPGRLMTDVVGEYYTMVLESEYESLTEFENRGKEISGNEEWRKWYGTFTPYVESGRREIFNVVL